MKFILEEGDFGQEVKRFQKNLFIDDDGKFGPKTREALREFQKNNCLSVDGVYGPQSQAAMGNDLLPGVDVSSHQGEIDWNELARTQRFAIVKLSEGRTHKNPGRIERYAGAKRAGLTVGAYHYAKPLTDRGIKDAEAEAQHFMSLLNAVGWERGVDLAPVLDLEDGDSRDDQYNVDWGISFLQRIEKELKVRPILYTGKWFYDSYMRGASKSSIEIISKYPLWLAHYSTMFGKDPEKGPWKEWSILQWTGSARMKGIEKKADRNFICGGQKGLKRLTGV